MFNKIKYIEKKKNIISETLLFQIMYVLMYKMLGFKVNVIRFPHNFKNIAKLESFEFSLFRNTNNPVPK